MAVVVPAYRAPAAAMHLSLSVIGGAGASGSAGHSRAPSAAGTPGQSRTTAALSPYGLSSLSFIQPAPSFAAAGASLVPPSPLPSPSPTDTLSPSPLAAEPEDPRTVAARFNVAIVTCPPALSSFS